MALPSTSVWEARPTVGSDTNGGGFDSAAAGTDMSQFNNKNSSGGTNCQSTTNNLSTTDLTTTTTGGFTCTSTTAAFTTAITGNLIYLTGGTGGTVSTNWYRATYVSSTQITLDRSPGAAATLVTMNIGGALATIAQANTNNSGENICYVKSTGTYTVTATLTISNMWIIGYTTSRGDNGQFTWTTATNSVALVTIQASNVGLYNIIFTTTAGTKAAGAVVGATLSSIIAVNCSWNGFSIGLDLSAHNCYSELTNCQIINSVGIGLKTITMSTLVGCYIGGNGTDGINIVWSDDGALTLINSIVYNNGNKGINLGSNNQNQMPILVNSAFVSNASDGVYTANNSNHGNGIMINCIFYNNSGYGVNFTGGVIQSSAIELNCAYGSNNGGGTGLDRLVWPVGAGAVALTADPFTSKSGGNFLLNSNAGGGSACLNAGFPGVLGTGGTGFNSIGPILPTGGVSTVPLTLQVSDYIAIADI